VAGDAALAGASDIQPANERAAAPAAAPTNFLIAVLLRSLLDTLKITRIANFRSSRLPTALTASKPAGHTNALPEIKDESGFAARSWRADLIDSGHIRVTGTTAYINTSGGDANGDGRASHGAGANRGDGATHDAGASAHPLSAHRTPVSPLHSHLDC
jgi:hypothetical protein